MTYLKSEAAKLFHSEVREKKRTASGVHYKTGKNGYVGNMRFPSDIMSRKDKMRYRRNGKVMISNMYDEILTIEEFEKLEPYEQKNRLQYWRNTYTNKEIMEKMGIWNAQFYKIVKELDLPKAARVHTEKPKRKAAVKKKETEAIQPPAPVVQEIIVDGLHLVYNGTYKAEKIQKQLKKIIALLEDETDNYYVELKVMQKTAEED